MSRLKKILSDIKEKFVDGKEPLRGDYTEVFINPTQQEIEDSLREWGEYPNIRFLAVKGSKDLYVWNPDLIHKDVTDIVGMSFEEMKENNLAGVAIYINKKLIFGMSNIASMDKYRRRELADKILSGEWDWLERYNFDLEPMKDDCEKFLDTGEFDTGQIGI